MHGSFIKASGESLCYINFLDMEALLSRYKRLPNSFASRMTCTYIKNKCMLELSLMLFTFNVHTKEPFI